MSIRPVDLQVMVQKSADVSKLNQNDVERPTINYQQFSDKLQKDVEHEDQSVANTNKAEENAVNEDGKGNSGGSYGKRRKEREKKEAAKKTENKSMFDVSI